MNTCLRIGKSLLTKSCIVCLVLIQMVIGIFNTGFTKLRNCPKNWLPYYWKYRIAYPKNNNIMGSAADGFCFDQGQPLEYKENTKKENERLLLEVEDLKNEISDLKHQNREQKEMITKHLGKKVERTTQGKFHKTTDTSQAAKFCSMYEKEWRDAMGVIRDDKEIAGIRFLSKILEECQTFCQAKANEQLAFFINPFGTQHCSEPIEIKQAVPDDEDLYNLQKIRRNVSMHKSVKSALRESFQQKYIEMDEFKTLDDFCISGENWTSRLENFVVKCCDLCWQCAIADPQVNLEFGVKDQPMGEIEDRFSSYPLTEEVNEHGKSNTVMEVVWPACFKSEGGIKKVLAKGTVILY